MQCWSSDSNRLMAFNRKEQGFVARRRHRRPDAAGDLTRLEAEIAGSVRLRRDSDRTHEARHHTMRAVQEKCRIDPYMLVQTPVGRARLRFVRTRYK